jgi:hypothetical protein
VGQDVGGDRKPDIFLQTEFNEAYGQLSPDGHWMAFTSDVRPFPKAEGEWKISISGGEQPRWSGDGKELFFVAADGKMTAVRVKAAPGPKPSFDAGTPEPLFDAHMAVSQISREFQYDVTADGKRFLINTKVAASSTAPLTVMVNWLAGVKK